MITRRAFMSGAFGVAGTVFNACSAADANPSPASGAQSKTFEITKTEEEWKRLLSRDRFLVLRRHVTEPAGSSPLDREHRRGLYHCAGCDLSLFSSAAKFDSGTGWPSFTAPLDNAVGTSIDRSYFAIRTEVHCRRCGGHLGHVFPDGPRPTGMRYCMNGLALVFRPETTSDSR
jgi:peptide-methionine (R)-S-oxide reductase